MGAGFGGLTVATILRENLSLEHKFTIIDKKLFFITGFVNLWILFGTRTLDDSQTPLSKLNDKKIDFINNDVIEIALDKKFVKTKNSGSFVYDYLRIGLGPDLAPERT